MTSCPVAITYVDLTGSEDELTIQVVRMMMLTVQVVKMMMSTVQVVKMMALRSLTGFLPSGVDQPVIVATGNNLGKSLCD